MDHWFDGGLGPSELLSRFPARGRGTWRLTGARAGRLGAAGVRVLGRAGGGILALPACQGCGEFVPPRCPGPARDRAGVLRRSRGFLTAKLAGAHPKSPTAESCTSHPAARSLRESRSSSSSCPCWPGSASTASSPRRGIPARRGFPPSVPCSDSWQGKGSTRSGVVISMTSTATMPPAGSPVSTSPRRSPPRPPTPPGSNGPSHGVSCRDGSRSWPR
jgi:hypothetical protein